MSVRTTKVKVSATDRLTLDQRLRLHQRLQPVTAWSERKSWIFTVAPVFVILPILFTDPHSKSVWPVLPLSAYGLFTIVFLQLCRLWRRNIEAIAAYDSIVAVAPLLDFADMTFLRPYCDKAMPLSEAIVLSHLPTLLTRMPAGDGPELTQRQQATLRQLISSCVYGKRFNLPGLREKIEAMTGSQP